MASRTTPRSALSLLARSTRIIQTPATSATAARNAARQLPTAVRYLSAATFRPRPSARTTTTPPSLAFAAPGAPLAPRGARTIFIQTEATPNADAVKFVPNHRVIPETITVPYIEYLNPRSTISPPYPSPLAANLMNVEGVTSVFYGTDFITVTKDPDANWAHIRPEVFALITEAVTSGQTIVATAEGKEGHPVEEDSLAYDENDSEVVGMIKELLDTRIRPAIQEDGGDIEFRGFEDGYVLLKLRGACRTCDSSTVTLKNGIEGMLMHYVSLEKEKKDSATLKVGHPFC